MAGTSPAMTSDKWFNMTGTRSKPASRRRAGAELPIEQVVHDFSVDDRQDGVELPDRFVGNAHLVEIVVAQYDDIAELAFFDRAQPIFLLEEPAVLDGVESDRLFTGDLLTAIDQLSGNVLARDHVVDHVPWIQRGDLCRIRSGADMDAAVDDHAQRRAAVGAAAQVAERMD